MRPFGCPVTILNTLDNLGKFDGKADEGFFIGYLMNSKTFRVFNSRKWIVEENLHIRFCENTPNVIGSGPDWLFDIDSLTRTMNYEPIATGTQPNGFGDPKSFQDDGFQPLSDSGKKVVVEPSKRNECKDQDQNISNELPFDPDMPALEDISTFNLSSDHEDDDEEVDMNNIDTTIQVSHVPTIRIYKDHQLDQVIGDLHSTTQTRNMSKNLEEHEFVTTIHQRTYHKDLQNLDLHNGKRAIGTKWVFKNKKDKRGIMIRNKVRLVAQGHTQEEGIDYDKVFALVARIEAIRLFLAFDSFKDFLVYQMDVKSAFLYKKIKEEVYVCQPLGFEDPDIPVKVGKIDKTLFVRRYKGDVLLVQVYVDDIIFGSTKDLCGEKVFVAKQDENVVEKVVDATQVQVSTAATTPTISIDDVTLAQALSKLKHTKPKAKAKRIVFMRQKKSSKKAKAKVMEGSSKRAGTELEQESFKKQKIDDDKETTELKQLVKIMPDEEGVAIDAIPLAVKPPSIVDWKIQKEGKKTCYKIIKADESPKIYLVFSHMLKDFDREDVETLWRMVKAKHGSTKPEGDNERVL
nr:hypothetical protein [Tanacetum cinerariifolium]